MTEVRYVVTPNCTKNKVTMCKKYTHLTLDERCIIYALLSNNSSIRSISKELNVSPSTISREIKRNSKNNLYHPTRADKRSKKRRIDSSSPRSITPIIRAKIIHGLSQYFSPVQISGSLKKSSINISHETIYKFVWNDKKYGGQLYTFLRHSGKIYNKRSNKNAGRGFIPDRVDISERDPIVDTVIGANHKGAIVTLVDRCSKISLMKIVENKTKELVTRAIIELLSPYKNKVHTITFDNGKEFADHKIIAQILDAKCYFAQPYRSWERGLNEHTNGLLRQFVPKKTNFNTLRQEDIEKYQNLLNNRPRKILDFNTPIDVFFLSSPVALQT